MQFYELFFSYDKKHIWSIWSNNDDYGLSYYPKHSKTEDLARTPLSFWKQENIVHLSFNETDFRTTEASQSFAALYSTVSNKQYNMDSILDEIIATDIF